MAELCPFEITPYVTTTEKTHVGSYTLNHTGQDYWSLRSMMFELIKQKFDKDFNDFTEASLGVMLIELFAHLGDQLSFKIDQIANEIGIDSVTELYNANRLAKLVGFRPTPPLPAKAMFVATINGPLLVDLNIQTPIPITFMVPDGEKTLELFPADANNNTISGNIVIPAGKLSTTAIAGLEGRTFYTSASGTGLSWQKVDLGIRNVLFRSIRIAVDGSPWEEVDNFTASFPRKEFRVEYMSDYKAVVIFGDNITGLIPQKGSNIAVSYRVGGGEVGNIVTGSIQKSLQLSVAGINHLVAVHIKNYTKGEGGYDGDSIEDIRKKLPIYARTQNRAVTGEDYKFLASNFASSTNGLIGKANPVLRNYGCTGNVIDIYVLAQQGNGLAVASNNLKLELMAEINRKRMLTDYVCVRDGDILYVDVHIGVTVDRFQNRFEQTMRERISRRLQEFFSLYNWDFGQALRDSDIIKTLADIKEIEQIDVTFTTVKSIEEGQGNVHVISPNFHEIIRADNLNLEFVYK